MNKQEKKSREKESVDKNSAFRQPDTPSNSDHNPERADMRDHKEDQKLEEKWLKIKEKFLEKYSNITNKDIAYKRGEFGSMLGRLERKTGKTRGELDSEIDRWRIGQQKD